MHVGNAAKKHKLISPKTNQDLFLPIVSGNVSHIPVITDSNPPNFNLIIFKKSYKVKYLIKKITVLSIPRVNSIKKNIMAHIGAPGIMLIACGYVTNMSPGPGSVT